jgi:hypothetical protein
MPIGLTDELTPLGSFHLLQDSHLKGGMRIVADITARNAIVSTSRKAGMVVWVQSESKTYRLGSGLLDADWYEDSGGGGGGGLNSFPNWGLVPADIAYSNPNNRTSADLAWSPTLKKFLLSGNTDVQFKLGDGYSWVTLAPPSNAYFKKVIWAGAPLNAFIAFALYDGVEEDVGVSTDGLTWPDVYVTFSADWSCAAFAPAPFNGGLGRIVVMASSNGATTSMTSDDAITWNDQGNVGGGFRDILFSEALGLFVAVGDLIRRSSTGLTGSWSSAAYTPSSYFRSIAWSPTLGIFVAVTDIDTDRIIYSTDANNWTAATPPEVGDWVRVVWANDVFVVLGPSSTALISVDGINWIIRTTPALTGLETAAYAPELGYILAVPKHASGALRVTKYLISEYIDNKPIHIEDGIKLRSEKIDEFAVTASGGETVTIYAFQTAMNGSSVGLFFEVIATRLAQRAHFIVSALVTRNSASAIDVQDITYLNGPYRDDASWDIDVVDAEEGVVAITVTNGGSPLGAVAWRITGTATEHYVQDGPDPGA